MTPDTWSVALPLVIAPSVVVGLGYLALILYERGSR